MKVLKLKRPIIKPRNWESKNAVGIVICDDSKSVNHNLRLQIAGKDYFLRVPESDLRYLEKHSKKIIVLIKHYKGGEK